MEEEGLAYCMDSSALDLLCAHLFTDEGKKVG